MTELLPSATGVLRFLFFIFPITFSRTVVSCIRLVFQVMADANFGTTPHKSLGFYFLIAHSLVTKQMPHSSVFKWQHIKTGASDEIADDNVVNGQGKANEPASKQCGP